MDLFDVIVASASADAGTRSLVVDCRTVLLELFVELVLIFIESAISVGHVPLDAVEFAFSDLARGVAMRQLLCADIRHRATNKRLTSARTRKAFRKICQECASVAVLRSVTRKAVKIVTRKLSEKLAKDFETHGHLGYDRDHNQAVVASIENLAGFIKGQKITLISTYRAVYVIIRFVCLGEIRYGVWEREFVNDYDECYGYGDLCDPNFLVAEKLYAAKTSDEIIKITCDDLKKVHHERKNFHVS